MAWAFAVFGMAVVLVAVGIERHKAREDRRNGNGFDKLEQAIKRCKCKGL